VPEKKQKKTLLLLAPILLYCFIGIEIIIMISPFALYFYSVYAPLLKFLNSSPLLSWTTEFFLPHMVFPDDPIIIDLSYLQVLLVVGLVLFFSAAIPLYWGRFTRKGVVQISFYKKIRHPQYLFLAISGFGLLLYWPRFIILILYVTMCYVYYLLARHEERRMKKEQPEQYEQYLQRTPMFLPGEPGGKIFRVLFGWLKPKWAALLCSYFLVLVLSLLAAEGLRQYTISVLPKKVLQNVMLIPVFPRPAEEIEEFYQEARNAMRKSEFSADIDKANLVYLMPGDFFLTALVTDENRRFSDDMIQRFPEILEWHQHKFKGGVRKFFKIFYNFVSTLGTVDTNYDIERLIFMRVSDENGNLVEPTQVLNMGMRRRPVLLVDLDAYDYHVLSIIKTNENNKWGSVPMPTF
jgi:protein-S-isoprenylcysteine O-methyltransferase Ste14